MGPLVRNNSESRRARADQLARDAAEARASQREARIKRETLRLMGKGFPADVARQHATRRVDSTL